ncbi:MAG: sulfatase-like hydrolase/transferase [Candidatus Limnocylindrales bacterium]
MLNPGRHLSRVLVAFSLVLAVGLGVPGTTRPAQAATKPDIVLIHMDDWSPKVRRLWSDPDRTPALAKFARAGVEFRNATGSTPLCTPGRANLITGQWGHNNGVTTNNPRLYDPADNLSIKVRDAGYHTIFGGKFLIKMEKHFPKRADVLPLARGWDRYDLIWKRTSKANAYYYKYLMWTKARTVYHGAKARDHSTRIVAQRIAGHIRNAPADKPLFVEMSLFDGHKPNLPMKQFVGHPKCRGVGGWSGLGYDESNVKDKPAWVRSQPRLKARSYPLRKACEEIMTVDWAVQKVRNALASQGRLADTLMILTADNGWMMGEHRLLGGKRVPYATPIPLYVRWPAQIGNERRLETERVSNVDVAPTICAAAGCALPDADGMSLLPIIRGDADRVNRLFVYEEFLDSVDPAPGWYSIRTTKKYSTNRRWVYTEYRTGARELYDLTSDPGQLRNLIREPRHRARAEDLRDLLHREVIGPDDVRWGEIH